MGKHVAVVDHEGTRLCRTFQEAADHLDFVSLATCPPFLEAQGRRPLDPAQASVDRIGDRLEEGVDGGDNPVPCAGRVLAGRSDQTDPVLLLTFQNSQIEGAFGAEVVVDGALGHPGSLGHLVEGRRGEAVLEETSGGADHEGLVGGFGILLAAGANRLHRSRGQLRR